MQWPARLRNVWTFLVFFCLCFFLETITFTYFISAVQSIERQFQIPSKLTGGLVSAGDIGYICTVVFLAHFGSRGNRPRWIGGGCLLISLACFLISMPGFIFPTPDMNFNMSQISTELRNMSQPEFAGYTVALPNNQSPLDLLQKDDQANVMKYAKAAYAFCEPLGNRLKQVISNLSCRVEDTNTAALGLVFTGIVLIGIGHSMPWSLGVPLLDDSVKKSNAPLYFGGVFFIRIFGPVLGFILGGVLNRFHVTLDTPAGLNEKDPRWIGAWWVGYLGISVALVVPSLLLFFFPDSAIKMHRQLTTSRTPVEERDVKDEADAADLIPEPLVIPVEESSKTNITIANHAKEFFASIRDVLRSPIYVTALCGRLFDAFAFKGFFVFLPKYLQFHYGMSSYQSGFLLGIAGVAGFALGVAGGSVITRLFKLDGRRVAAYVGACSAISVVLSGMQAAWGCQSVTSQVGEAGKNVNFNFDQKCNTDCYCESTTLFPVCTSDGDPYFSPCYAGCKNVTVVSMEQGQFEFTGCACAGYQTVSREFCKDDCRTMVIAYFTVMIISGIIGGTSVIPSVMIVLRSVPDKHRSTALGFSAFVVSLISTFPSPVVFGYIVDTACLSWSSSCNALGTCQLYDTKLLRLRTHLFNTGLRCFALIFDVLVWYFAKDLRILVGKEEDDAEMVEAPERKRSRKPNHDLAF